MRLLNRGDKIEAVAKPIARAFDFVFGTNVQNCAGCSKMRDNLNAGMTFWDAVYDRFWVANDKQTETMQYIITKQMAVEAETPEEAVQKIDEGKTISLSVNPRPQPQIQPRPPQTLKAPQ